MMAMKLRDILASINPSTTPMIIKLGVTLWHHDLRVDHGKETCVDGILQNNSASSHRRDAELNLSDAIILCQEICPVPIKDFFLGFLFRMDIEFIENHHFPVPCIINRPLMRLAVGGDVCGK